MHHLDGTLHDVGADAAWKKKNYKVAKSEYEAACKADVLSFPAALGLAKVCAATAATPADRQRALDCYKTACSLRPGSVSTFLAAGELATAVKQYATAVELYSRAVAADPSNISAIDGLIRSLRKTGDGKTADAYQRYRDTISAKKAK